ncbi:transcriptional regulator, LuxR family [Thermacetogenium phaeum DSM 12270]|uniref:Transcriptional regulator, LuxR family n=1 Tax=Thermacetogenium phaeum (strain ATCC BAA-254 / DSM 26808 / PB) TaxID=1089553 RepID=K4LFH8_THEPS|nr:helix-turn-helix transcriptional regulator [Thermacetogenium phaeum]AFV11618.1 transcriptional regulator, LuxR family [Thermacetogenium phaeum DSM 12270]
MGLRVMPSFPKEPKRRDYFHYLCSAEELEASRARCRLLGVPVELGRPAKILTDSSLTQRLATNALLIALSEHVITPDCYTGPSENFLYILCDPELVALKIFAAPEVLVATEDLGIKPGTVFTEASCGTNALALAHEYNRLVATRGKQHYCKLFEDWWCIASPVTNQKGRTLGYLDISMPAAKELGLAVAFFKKLLKLIEQQLTTLEFRKVDHRPSDTPSPPPAGDPNYKALQLTSREEEILNLRLLGLDNQEIAARLCISPNTVKVHCARIYRKLGVHSFPQLIAKIYR